MSHMESIGVRELRRDASRWLARVRTGEEFVITDRGRPVARLGPVPELEGWDALVANGRLLRGSGRPVDAILDELDHLAPASEGSVADALADVRGDER